MNEIELSKRAKTKQAERTDQKVISMWLHGKSEHTQESYERDLKEFIKFSEVPGLKSIVLEDLQEYNDYLKEKGLATSTIARKLSAVKSLLTFAYKIGYLPVNVGKAIEAPAVKDNLNEKILTEEEVFKMINLEEKFRNKVLLKFLYASAARVSEVCSLKWKNLHEHKDSGVVTIHGKGEKTRNIKLSSSIWKDLMELKERNQVNEKSPVFESQLGGHLDRTQVYRIVRKAAKKAGIDKTVSPHWLRHAHASHALDRQAPPHVVRNTLGHSSLATTNRYANARPDESSGDYLSI